MEYLWGVLVNICLLTEWTDIFLESGCYCSSTPKYESWIVYTVFCFECTPWPCIIYVWQAVQQGWVIRSNLRDINHRSGLSEHRKLGLSSLVIHKLNENSDEMSKTFICGWKSARKYQNGNSATFSLVVHENVSNWNIHSNASQICLLNAWQNTFYLYILILIHISTNANALSLSLSLSLYFSLSHFFTLLFGSPCTS